MMKTKKSLTGVKEEAARRFPKPHFYSIIVLSLVSIIVLIYQTHDFYANGTCCGNKLPEILAAFHQYGVISFNYASIRILLPISLLGIIIMTMIIIQTLILAYLPIPFNVRISNSKITLNLTLTEKFISLYHVFLVIQSLFYSLLVINLIYIELFVIRSVCLLCTISQGTILFSTLLIGLWSPVVRPNEGKKN